MHHYTDIVLHIPHASCARLDTAGWQDRARLHAQARCWTDWRTDELFPAPADPRIRAVRFPLSRFVCDVERLEDDPLEAEGRGIVYTRFEDNARRVSALEAAALRGKFHEHQKRLMACISPTSLVIDCHSFPADDPHLAAAGVDVDICLGWNEDWSRPPQEVLDAAARHFSAAGYSVGLNAPYSNSISPAMAFPYHSLMVEINKRCYLDEVTLSPTAGFQPLQSTIHNLYTLLLENK